MQMKNVKEKLALWSMKHYNCLDVMVRTVAGKREETSEN